MKEEFKCQKEFYDSFFKKSQSKSQASTPRILGDDISNRFQRTNSEYSVSQLLITQSLPLANNHI